MFYATATEQNDSKNWKLNYGIIIWVTGSWPCCSLAYAFAILPLFMLPCAVCCILDVISTCRGADACQCWLVPSHHVTQLQCSTIHGELTVHRAICSLFIRTYGGKEDVRSTGVLHSYLALCWILRLTSRGRWPPSLSLDLLAFFLSAVSWCLLKWVCWVRLFTIKY